MFSCVLWLYKIGFSSRTCLLSAPGSSKLFPSLGFPTKTLYTPLLSPIRATRPAHLIRDLITRIVFGEEYRSLSSTLWILFHSPGTLSFLDPNILLSTLFSNSLSLRSSLNVSDQYQRGCHAIFFLSFLMVLSNGPLEAQHEICYWKGS